MSTAGVMVCGLTAVSAVVFYGLYQYTEKQRRAQDSLLKMERLSSDLLINVEAAVDQIDERIERANQKTAEIDERIAALQSLADEVQKRILFLEELRQQQAQGGQATQQVPANMQTAVEACEVGAEPPKKKRRARKRVGAQAEALVAKVEEKAVQKQQDAGADAARSDKNAKVYALADQGMDLQQISLQTGIPRGEVQLILALRSTATQP